MALNKHCSQNPETIVVKCLQLDRMSGMATAISDMSVVTTGHGAVKVWKHDI